MRFRPFSPEKVPVPPDFRPFKVDPCLPLDLEIGCGAGFHPIRYARENPGRQLIAIERTKEKFEKFLGRIQGNEPLPNLIPVHGDGIAWVTHGLEAETVDRIFLLYPNPYPKESQRNLRFHLMPFFGKLREVLKPGGELVLATNMKFYAEEAREIIPAEWGMELKESRVIGREEAPRTHFERKYLLRGETCWNLIFRKPLV